MRRRRAEGVSLSQIGRELGIGTTSSWNSSTATPGAPQGEARQAIFRYIETWYNRKRRHSTLQYLSPIQYEQQLRMAA